MPGQKKEPKVAARKPIRLELEAGTYHWCACGKSANQPFCDGSHQGSGFTPTAFTLDEQKAVMLCLCKHTGNKPYCDGSHMKLKEDRSPGKRAQDNITRANTNTVETNLEFIQTLARHGLTKIGMHGPLAAMGVPVRTLPLWDDLQVLTAQLAIRPLADGATVGTDVTIGTKAKKPLHLKIPVFVSDMSFGALSEEAKVALATGAEGAGTAICSGEGGMLPEEQAANSRYLFELSTAKYGYSENIPGKVQAFHFKAGQGAKTGVGGHLPAAKVTEKIAGIRNIETGKDAVAPSRFADLETPQDFRAFADRVREISGGIPIGMKMSANHIEEDVQFALDAGVDYIILDGRGGGTGASPMILRDNISVPTIPALARARRYLDESKEGKDVTLIITGGLRTPADFVKALCLGADAVAIANSALQSIGCVAARICHTGNCPVGITTQNAELRKKLDVKTASAQLTRFLESTAELMRIMARACGHKHLNEFNRADLSTWKREMAHLTGIAYSGLCT